MTSTQIWSESAVAPPLLSDTSSLKVRKYITPKRIREPNSGVHGIKHVERWRFLATQSQIICLYIRFPQASHAMLCIVALRWSWARQAPSGVPENESLASTGGTFGAPFICGSVASLRLFLAKLVVSPFVDCAFREPFVTLPLLEPPK